MVIGIINNVETSDKMAMIQKELNEVMEQQKKSKKTCKKCKIERDLCEFYNGRNVCKICVIEHYKDYYRNTSKPKYTKGGEYYKYVCKKKNKAKPNKIINNVINLLQS